MSPPLGGGWERGYNSFNMTKVGHYEYLTEAFQVDFTGKLSLGVLSNHILNVAGMNAATNGFGIEYLNQQNCTWVLSRLVIEMEEHPREGDMLHIDTWVESVMNLFSGRNFALKSADGRTFGYARSIWAMIDTESRKPMNLLEINGGVMAEAVVSDKECPIDKPGKIKVVSREPASTFTVRYTDIDINVHLNSVRYVERILDLFPLEKFKTKQIHRFEIAFMAEALFGETLDLYIDSDESTDIHQVEMRKHDSGEVACRAKITFREML